jgi:hypothetical protein
MPVVIAIHEVEDVAGFWSSFRAGLRLGKVARLGAMYPLVNGARAVSVWDGPSADAVGDLVDAHLGHFGTNEIYEVDQTRHERMDNLATQEEA